MQRQTGAAVVSTAGQIMPRPNRRLTALAREVAARAERLLPAGAGLFLGVESNATGSVRLIWWRGRDLAKVAEIAATPEGFCSMSSDEGAMQEAAAAFLDYFAGRWPVAPETLGIITDGSGVAFTPDHPAPSAEGWLLRHALGEASLTTILPMDPTGACALLAHHSGSAIH